MLNFENIEELMSNTNETGSTAGCMFCDVENTLILFETENLYLIRDKFPITHGHLMVISKGHFRCMGELPTKFFTEIQTLRKQTEKIYQNRPYLAYEHGRAGHCVKLSDSLVTCHHFHFHFVPLSCDLHDELKNSYSFIIVKQLVDVRRHYQKLGEYLYFEDSNRSARIYPATHHVAPHLLRTMVCDRSNLSQRADWEHL